ncbi:crossover junction endodeoxyribonuclease RuvC, partial [Bacillus cereus group sp. TH230-1LC]|nr:crossover junction endodeoxyribonuclease RuvC [Bacillus cereus group sp. TH230-1LC]
DLTVAEYTALQMKKAITGNGRAAKGQIQAMVQHMLRLPGLPGPDAADALGLAITHAHAAPMLDKLADQTSLQRRQHAMLKAGRVY